jgi:F420-non-reducing hydrogenase iron-sulfur subunit
MTTHVFEPKIIVFVCSWCPSGAVESTAMLLVNPRASVRVIRVLCSGMIDPSYVIKAFDCGADGVLIIGCHPGNCHYISGNIKALRRSMLLKKLLVELGVEESRFRLEWIAHSEQHRYAAVVNDMSDHLQTLGPFRLQGISVSSNTGLL